MRKTNIGIPILRFSGFQNEWNKCELGSFLEEFRETVKAPTTLPIFSSTRVGLIPQKKYYDNHELQNEGSYGVVPRNYFTYRHMSDDLTFKFNINRYADKIAVSKEYPVFKTVSLNSKFLLLKLNYGNDFKQFAIQQKKGGTRTRLYFKILRKWKTRLPSLREQQKIAEFLGTVDEWIENLEKQKDALETYKKGMMQKIFSQVIRFKDTNGKNFPKWEEKQLKKILKERKNYSVKGSGYDHISLTTNGVVTKTERYNRDFLVGNDIEKKYKITKINDLCYNPANLKFGVIAFNRLKDGIFSPIYVTFEIIDQDINFVDYYLTRKDFINKARRYEQGTVYERMAVSPEDFLKVKLLFPSLPEQKKIAEFLGSIDKFLKLKQGQILKAKLWKKGLLQQMFI